MTPEIENVGIAILKGICNPEAKDLMVDLGEFELGTLFDESVLKEIPAIKTVIACRKTWMAMRDQLFLRKVAEFLSACPRFTEAEKETFVRDHLSDTQKAKRLGDSLVLILDRLDDMEKPQMIATVFAAFMRGKIGFDIFRRLAAAIDVGVVEDLREFAKFKPFPIGPPKRQDNQARLLHINLIRTGLVGPQNTTGLTAITSVSFVVSELGQIFKICMSEAKDYVAETSGRP